MSENGVFDRLIIYDYKTCNKVLKFKNDINK